MHETRDAPSPLDAVDWPAQLTAKVVDPAPAPALHGYDVEADLARHYGALDAALLALGGELPGEPARGAVEVALVFASACSVAEAPVHAARIARVIGAHPAAMLGILGTALAEQARAEVEGADGLATWLADPQGEPPAPLRAGDAAARASVERLRQALASRGVEVPALRFELGRAAALQAVLWWAGVRRPEQVETLLVMARLPVAMAEALAARPLALKAHPTGLPAFAEVPP